MQEDRPLLLDLYCCQGGASTGYMRAGFDVIGADLARQRHYPFPFLQMDALEVLQRLLDGESLTFGDRTVREGDIAVKAASPPCQLYSITKHTHAKEYPDLVAPTRDLLRASDKPYVIENVPGAPLEDPLLLCGEQFHLTATDTDGTELVLRRHRLFESNVWLMAPGGHFHGGRQVGGVYGGGSDDRDWAKNVRRGGYTPSKPVREALMGIDWMTLDGLSESIPPAYTEWIGHQVLATL